MLCEMLGEEYLNEQENVITRWYSCFDYRYCYPIIKSRSIYNEFEIARNATNARDAAKAISSNNQTYGMDVFPLVCSLLVLACPNNRWHTL